jgi:hypothetical protein
MRFLFLSLLGFSLVACASRQVLPPPDLNISIFSPLAKAEAPSLKLARKYALAAGLSDQVSISRITAMIDEYGVAATERAIYEVSQDCRLEKRKFTLTEVKFYAEFYALSESGTYRIDPQKSQK